MKLGDAYFNNSHRHVCFVVSHPDANGSVVVVNTTTWTDEEDQDHACVIEGGEHSSIKHKSVIPYAFAEVVSKAKQDTIEANPEKYPTRDPLSEDLLERIQGGFEDSESQDDIPDECIPIVVSSCKRQRDDKRKAK